MKINSRIGKLALTVGAVGAWILALNARAAMPTPAATTYNVLAYNDLGMHCMGSRFGELCILPPANTMRATVIRRGGEPEIIDENLQITYSIPGNTDSVSKTDFWNYAYQLFGANLAPNMGLFGKGLNGTMDRHVDRDWIAAGVPITPVQDNGVENAYQLAVITVKNNSGTTLATTQAVMPVSWEMHCDFCHNTKGITPETDILRKHDKRHGTDLEHQKPVLCARCHADNALGAAGQPGISNLSLAMHRSHASRMKFKIDLEKDKTQSDGFSPAVFKFDLPKFGFASLGTNLNSTVQVTSSLRDSSPLALTPPVQADKSIGLANPCYACHPGVTTQCLRDKHESPGEACKKCHGEMIDVGNASRRPWIDEPKCSSCHHVAGHDYEEPGKLYRDSRGHGGVKCEACHGSPHAIFPTRVASDNVQSIDKQGHAGKIDTCTVCHTSQPNEPFFHSIEH